MKPLFNLRDFLDSKNRIPLVVGCGHLSANWRSTCIEYNQSSGGQQVRITTCAFAKDACHLLEGTSLSLPPVSGSTVFSITRPAAMCQCDFKEQVSLKRRPCLSNNSIIY
ncbi:MAG: hypothetical protein ACYSUY_13370 [Planctomycetota bacterium]